MIRHKEIVATGLATPEGPAVLSDQRILFVEQMRSQVSLYDGRDVAVHSRIKGAPNSIVAGSDGALYAAQNGGVVGSWRSEVRASPAIQRIAHDGTVTDVCTRAGSIPLRAPNDLVFGSDGRLYFTDPAEGYNPGGRRERGCLCVVDDSGARLVLDVGLSYPNGIAFTVDGRLLWVETYEREVCVLEDGERRRLCQLPEGHLPDGLDVAADGRLFITTFSSHGVTVLSPEGQVLDLLYLDEQALPTNCCFDGDVLWVTDFCVGFDRAPVGRLWRVETDAMGKAAIRGAVRLP